MNKFNPERYPQYIVDQVKEFRELNNLYALTDEQIQTMPRKNMFSTICTYNGYGSPAAIDSMYEDIYSIRIDSADVEYAIVNITTNEVDDNRFQTPEEALEHISTKDNQLDWKLAARMVIKSDWDLTGPYPGAGDDQYAG